MKKRGQIFVFAAVIISVIVMSMATIANRATVNEEPQGFYDYTFDVRRESGGVIDYEIYSGFTSGADLEAFVSLMAADLRDRDAQANFMFVYGNKDYVVVENYGTDVAVVSAGAGNALIPGGNLNIEGTISLGSSSRSIYEDYLSLGGTGSKAVLDGAVVGEMDRIAISILGNDLSFPLLENRQVIFLMQKEEGDETYVYIE